jgi:hypothetical protein
MLFSEISLWSTLGLRVTKGEVLRAEKSLFPGGEPYLSTRTIPGDRVFFASFETSRAPRLSHGGGFGI